MLNRAERIIYSGLYGGFLATELAWYGRVFNKTSVIHWQTLMQIAGVLWLVAVAALVWYKRSTILQQEIRGAPPWYFFMLAVPLCLYASLGPWFLMSAFTAIRTPVI